jgi:general secretion pathway protein D
VNVDYERKPGPLTELRRSVRTEMSRAENGGPGITDERVIGPSRPNAPPALPENSAPALEVPRARQPPNPAPETPNDQATPPPGVEQPQEGQPPPDEELQQRQQQQQQQQPEQPPAPEG